MSNATITFTGCPTCAGPVQAIADGDAVIYRHVDLSDDERIEAVETPLPVAYANTHHFKQVNDGFLAMRKPSEFHNVPLFTHPPAQPTKLEDGMVLVPERFVKAASNYVRCATSGTNLSPYIKENGLHGGSPWAEFVGEHAAMLTAERIKADERAVGSEWPYIEIVTLAWSKLRERDCLPEEWHEGDMVRALQAVWPKPPAQPTKLEDAVREVVALLRATSNTPASDRRYAAGLLTAALQENAK